MSVATTIGLVFGSLCLVWAVISWYATRNGTMRDYVLWLVGGALFLIVLETFVSVYYL